MIKVEALWRISYSGLLILRYPSDHVVDVKSQEFVRENLNRENLRYEGN